MKHERNKNEMKRLINILVIVFLLINLSSCGGSSFFSSSTLEKVQIADLEKPKNAEQMHLYNSTRLYFNSTKEDYEEYVAYLYSFLLEKNFVFLGTSGECLYSEPYKFGLGDYKLFEVIPSSEMNDHLIKKSPINTELYYSYKCYEFIYGNKIDSTTMLTDAVSLLIIYDENEEYCVEVRLNISEKINREEYLIDGSLYKCNLYVENTEYLYENNIPSFVPQDKSINIKILSIYENRIKVFINGEEIIKEFDQQSDEYVLYKFKTIAEDMYITFELADENNSD